MLADIGGTPVPVAARIASVMAGTGILHGKDDDALLEEVPVVPDRLYAACSEAKVDRSRG